MQLLEVGVVGEPGRVPVVDAVKVARVVESVVAYGRKYIDAFVPKRSEKKQQQTRRDRSQVLGDEHVECGDSLQMNGIIVIVRSAIRTDFSSKSDFRASTS